MDDSGIMPCVYTREEAEILERLKLDAMEAEELFTLDELEDYARRVNDER